MLFYLKCMIVTKPIDPHLTAAVLIVLRFLGPAWRGRRAKIAALFWQAAASVHVKSQVRKVGPSKPLTDVYSRDSVTEDAVRDGVGNGETAWVRWIKAWLKRLVGAFRVKWRVAIRVAAFVSSSVDVCIKRYLT
jgi:hypothetical protein